MNYHVMGKYSKDKNNVLFAGNKIGVADIVTFKNLKEGFGKDKNNIYYLGEKIEGADVKTFTRLEKGYSKDKNNVYLYGNKINGIDVKSLEILNSIYIRDKENYFCVGTKIEGIDYKSFELFKERYVEGISGVKQVEAEDKYNYYVNCLGDKRIKKIGKNYVNYNNNIYYTDGICLNNNIGPYYYDEDYYLFKSTEIKYSNHFIILKDGYSMDFNNVYYFGKIIIGANPKTFEVLDNGKSKDKYNEFYEGNIIKRIPHRFIILLFLGIIFMLLLIYY